MDIDGWEFIPADGFLDFCEDGMKKKIHYSNWGSDPKGVFDMNYFNCPLPDSRETARRENPRAPRSQLVPVPIIPVYLNPKIEKGAEEDDDDDDNADDKVAKEIFTEEEGGEADKESVSQVFFKKMKKENEFADKMKVDLPKSPTTTTRGFMPQNDAAKFEFDEDKEDLSSKKGTNSLESKNSDGAEDDGLNIWKWSLTGIGAICSFGVAAVTICILFFGGHHRNTQHQQSRKIRFQLYNDDKRIKQVVHHATNEASSAPRGVPLTRTAHVTFGGYYEGLQKQFCKSVC